MLDRIGNFISVGFGVLIAGAVLLTAVLGALAPAWDGTKDDRSKFWFIFLPCLLFLMLLSFWLGKTLESSGF